MNRNLYNEKIDYNVSAVWDGETGGPVNANGYQVRFNTPLEFNGKGKALCPDQLFLASISGCLMTTLISFKNRLGAEAKNIEITSKADIELQGNFYRIIGIECVISIEASEENYDAVKRSGELAIEYCYITRSTQSAIPIQFKIKNTNEETDI